jgi:hypothetical protein
MADLTRPHKGDFYLLRLQELDAQGEGEEGTDDLVLCLTNLGIDFSAAFTDLAPCRGDTENAGWQGSIPTTKSGTVSVEGYIRVNNDWEPVRFFDALDNETLLAFEIFPGDPSDNTPIVGGFLITGEAYIESMPLSFPSEDTAGYSLTLKLQGRPSMTTITGA